MKTIATVMCLVFILTGCGSIKSESVDLQKEVKENSKQIEKLLDLNENLTNQILLLRSESLVLAEQQCWKDSETHVEDLVSDNGYELRWSKQRYKDGICYVAYEFSRNYEGETRVAGYVINLYEGDTITLDLGSNPISGQKKFKDIFDAE